MADKITVAIGLIALLLIFPVLGQVIYVPPHPTQQLFGVNLAGAEFGTTYPGTQGTDYGFPTSTELSYWHGKGLTLIRMPLRWERVQPTLGAALDTTSAACSSTGYAGCISAFLTAADAVPNMHVLLDVHNYGRFCGAGTFADPTSCGTILGTSPVTNAQFADLWSRMATAFGTGHTSLIGYDLMNEPHDMGGSTVWPTAAQAAINAIRLVDTTHTIFVEGDVYSDVQNWVTNNPSFPLTDPNNNIRYSAHSYWDSNGSGNYSATYASQCPSGCLTIGVTRTASFFSWLSSNNVKGHIGEFGVPNDSSWLTVLSNFLTAANSNGVWATYWAAGPFWGCSLAATGNTSLADVPPCNSGTDLPQTTVLATFPSH